MHFHVITIFPSSFDSYLNESILKRAIQSKKIKVTFYNPRKFTRDKNARVDRRPYGGGPGMVLEAESILKAAKKAIGKKNSKSVLVVFFEPKGYLFNNNFADKICNRYKHVVLICGRYEGVDARVKRILKAKNISIGPYTVTGGELPAMILIDAVSRRLEGVLGKDSSVEERRIAGRNVYTRPEVLHWQGKRYRVPKILLSGNHARINDWKKEIWKK